MRQFGLILENLDGFSNPTTKFVMRGVPHTLGLQVSLERDTSLPQAACGDDRVVRRWSAGNGLIARLRDRRRDAAFHQESGRASRAPTSSGRSEHQLDAMEAFQLSLGRDKDFDLAKITFHERERQHRQSRSSSTAAATRKPAAPAISVIPTQAPSPPASRTRTATSTRMSKTCCIPRAAIQNFPKDGGFGRTANADGTFGNRTFNTASVVEAADTAPFFHNNVVTTLEGVVDFYIRTRIQQRHERPLHASASIRRRSTRSPTSCAA